MDFEELNVLRLPEWVWLKIGATDTGKPDMAGRTTLMHTPTHTILEFMHGTFKYIDPTEEEREIFRRQFIYTNSKGQDENHCIGLICSTVNGKTDPQKLAEIVKSGINWYKQQRDFTARLSRMHINS